MTARASLIVTTHGPVPPHAPDQPEKLPDADVARAVSVTTVPTGNDTAHVDAHATPAGDDVTVPGPSPATVTWSV